MAVDAPWGTWKSSRHKHSPGRSPSCSSREVLFTHVSAIIVEHTQWPIVQEAHDNRARSKDTRVDHHVIRRCDRLLRHKCKILSRKAQRRCPVEQPAVARVPFASCHLSSLPPLSRNPNEAVACMLAMISGFCPSLWCSHSVPRPPVDSSCCLSDSAVARAPPVSASWNDGRR